jgi:hypothetical protein
LLIPDDRRMTKALRNDSVRKPSIRSFIFGSDACEPDTAGDWPLTGCTAHGRTHIEPLTI